MLHRVALVRTDISEERSASFIRVIRIGELGTLAVTSNRRKLRGGAKFPETSEFTRATRCNIPEDGILHKWKFRISHCTGKSCPYFFRVGYKTPPLSTCYEEMISFEDKVLCAELAWNCGKENVGIIMFKVCDHSVWLVHPLFAVRAITIRKLASFSSLREWDLTVLCPQVHLQGSGSRDATRGLVIQHAPFRGQAAP
jgi:hypothetical protein